MNRYLLDTPLVSAYLLQRNVAVSLVQPWIDSDDAGTSDLVYAEVIEYIKGLAGYEFRRAQLRRLLRRVIPFSLTPAILELYADLRRQLRPPYGPGLIGDIDTLIAATAIERSLTIVTTDTDFQRVPGLNVTLVSLRG